MYHAIQNLSNKFQFEYDYDHRLNQWGVWDKNACVWYHTLTKAEAKKLAKELNEGE